MTLWLTPAELVELTGYKTAKRQKMALGRMNIPFRSREADGHPMADQKLSAAQIMRQPRRANPMGSGEAWWYINPGSIDVVHDNNGRVVRLTKTQLEFALSIMKKRNKRASK